MYLSTAVCYDIVIALVMLTAVPASSSERKGLTDRYVASGRFDDLKMSERPVVLLSCALRKNRAALLKQTHPRRLCSQPTVFTLDPLFPLFFSKRSNSMLERRSPCLRIRKGLLSNAPPTRIQCGTAWRRQCDQSGPRPTGLLAWRAQKKHLYARAPSVSPSKGTWQAFLETVPCVYLVGWREELLQQRGFRVREARSRICALQIHAQPPRSV